MMQQGGQVPEGRRPSSPRGGSSGGNNSNMSKFSLLGHQLTNFGSAQQQQHQNHPHSSNSSGMNFSLGVQSHVQQAFSQGHQQQQQPSQGQPNNSNGGGDGAGFSNMQSVNSMVGGAGQGFNQSHPFMNQQMLQQTSGGVADFLKISGQQATQSSQAVCMNPAAGVSQETLMNALSTIQQKIVQLQAMVPYMGQNQQMTNSTVQQQAAAAISQIAVVAANMFPGPQQQQQQQNMSSTAHLNPGAQQQQLGQLFGASVAPAFNFFQQGGSAPMNNNNGGGNSLENNFPALEGGSGVTRDNIGASGNMAIQIVDGGAPGNSSNGAGLSVAPKPATPSGGGQSFGGAQGGVNNGPSMPTNMNLALVVRTKHGSPLNNQMGSGITRGGAVAATAVEIPHMNSNRSVNSAGMTTSAMEDHDVGGAGSRDEEDDGDIDGDHLVPGSYDLVEMDAEEILAEHTHFCEICGKGFKRDANLRMHMRGHGDEYKTAAALARPDKANHEMTTVRPRRFSCPYVGCKRNKKHRKFQPLKTMLCVKNHYRRSHCPKTYICQKCKTKKFSVVADLKTHEKHCGCDKWQCSCGTTFSRKDKLFGHIGLFAGHTPAMPFNDVDGSGGLDVSEMGGGPGNASAMPNPGNNTSAGYGLSGGGGNLNSGVASSMGLGGGSGMGLGGNGLQGLSSRAGAQGNSVLNVPKDGNVLPSDTSSSSDSFPSPGNLLPAAMLQSLFPPNFMQNNSGGNSSPEGLH